MSKKWLYACAFSLCAIDIISASLAHHYIIYSLLCFYACALFQTKNKKFLVFMLCLICLQQFLVLGNFGIALIYLLPAAGLAYKLQNLFYSKWFLPLIIITFCLTAQLLIINPLILGIFDKTTYTIGKFFANILLTGLFSLKFKFTES